MPLRQLQGDLFDYASTHYLCHQCNCTSFTPKGLSLAMFIEFPHAHAYKKGFKRVPGTIAICEPVINMFAQYYVGHPSSAAQRYAPGNRLLYAYGIERDTYAKRKEYFQQCLDAMHATLPSDAKVAFPYHIGCGLAAGLWEDYYAMIAAFAEKRPERDVIIVEKVL